MNANVMAGLGAALTSYGNNYQEEQRAKRDEALAMRKAEMAMQLEMRLMQAKQEYAKANPTYNKFVQGRFGDVIGFDEQGNTKQLYTAPEEERQSYKDEYAAQQAYKEAQAGNAEMKALLAPMLAGAKVERDTAAAGKDNKWVPTPKKPEKDPSVLSAAEWVSAMSKFLPADFGELEPDEKAQAIASAEQTLESQGLRKAGGAPAPAVGLAAPTTTEVDTSNLMDW